MEKPPIIVTEETISSNEEEFRREQHEEPNKKKLKQRLEPQNIITNESTTTTPTTNTTKRAIPLSKNMEYILQQEALAKGLDPALLKSNDFSHLIVKGARDDEFMYLSVMVRRLTLCCPYHSSHDVDSDAQISLSPKENETRLHLTSPSTKDKDNQLNQAQIFHKLSNPIEPPKDSTQYHLKQ